MDDAGLQVEGNEFEGFTADLKPTVQKEKVVVSKWDLIAGQARMPNGHRISLGSYFVNGDTKDRKRHPSAGLVKYCMPFTVQDGLHGTLVAFIAAAWDLILVDMEQEKEAKFELEGRQAAYASGRRLQLEGLIEGHSQGWSAKLARRSQERWYLTFLSTVFFADEAEFFIAIAKSLGVVPAAISIETLDDASTGPIRATTAEVTFLRRGDGGDLLSNGITIADWRMGGQEGKTWVSTKPYKHSAASGFKFVFNELSSLTVLDGAIGHKLASREVRLQQAKQKLTEQSSRLTVRVDAARVEATRRSSEAVANAVTAAVWAGAEADKEAAIAVSSPPTIPDTTRITHHDTKNRTDTHCTPTVNDPALISNSAQSPHCHDRRTIPLTGARRRSSGDRRNGI